MIIRDFSFKTIEVTDAYLKKAFLREQEYFLGMEEDRLLAGFYEAIGKIPKKKAYPGNDGEPLAASYAMGQYLSSMAHGYASDGNDVYLERLKYVVNSLAECQSGTGYLASFKEELIYNTEQGKPAGAPWSALHRLMEGLICVYQMAALPAALDVAVRLGDWVSSRVNRWDEETRARVLKTEYGGMNDCLYELYKESGKIEFMMAAEKFDDMSLFQKIADGSAAKGTVAASAAKVLGALNRYLTVGEEQQFYLDTAKQLFDLAEQEDTTYFADNAQDLAKLAGKLFLLTGEKKYLDFCEKAYWNVVVASKTPKTGFGGIYFKQENTVYVGMYISSELTDAALGLRIKTVADLPGNPIVKVTVDKNSEAELKLAFRKPEWSKGGFSVIRKGKNLITEEKNGFVFVSVEKGTTELEVAFMPEIGIHSLTDNPDTVVFTYGPLVLSAENDGENTVAVFGGTVEEWKKHPEMAMVRQGTNMCFRLSGTDKDKTLLFSPHYTRLEGEYGVYWELIKGEELVQVMPETNEKKKTKKPLMIVLLVIIALLLLLTAFFAALEFSEGFRNAVLGKRNNQQTSGDNIGNIPTETPTPTVAVSQGDSLMTIAPTPTEQPVRVIQWMSSVDLEKEAALANNNDLRGFKAIVEKINSQQYLSFYNDTYKVSYKFEEAPTIYSHAVHNEVIISNGTSTEIFYWDYSIGKGEAAKLCPYVGDFCNNGREQLAFSFLEGENDKADTLHVVAGNTLKEYYVIRPEAALNNLIKVNGYLDAGDKVLADLTSDSRNYYVALDDCLLELAEEVYAVCTDSHLTYEISENSIMLQSFVEVGNGQYIGRIRGTVSYSSRDVFRLSSPSFYVFAEDDFCDVDSMGIVTPVSEAELYLTRIPVTGDGGERLLVRAREEIGFHDLKAENFRYDENGFLAYYKDNVKISMTGVDVSKWQYDVNWKKVKEAGVDYAIIRLGYRGTAAAGNCAMDPYYEQNIKGALEAGLQVGVYYFTQAITVEEAIEEANIVIDELKGYNITFPVVYDTEYREDGRANNLSNAERTACAKAFCDTILAAGYTPVIYSSTNWSILNLNLEELQGYDFWYAYYGAPENLYMPYGFTMWQYTESGRVDGIETNVDLNISFMDYSTR